jgi:hypothetical protein
MPPPHAAYAGNMMRDTQRGSDDCKGPTRRWSRVSLILIGILLGSMFVRPAVAHVGTWAHNWIVHIKPRVQAYGDARWVRKAAVQTGYFSCAGTAWESVLEGTTFETSGSLKYRTGGPATALFRCNAQLPEGATVQAARFTVKDGDATVGNDVTCSLWRTDMTTTIGTDPPEMALAATSGAPGAVQISDTTVTDALVDNAKYSYFLQCDDVGSTTSIGIYGANIEYTVSGLRGAAS